MDKHVIHKHNLISEQHVDKWVDKRTPYCCLLLKNNRFHTRTHNLYIYKALQF